MDGRVRVIRRFGIADEVRADMGAFKSLASSLLARSGIERGVVDARVAHACRCKVLRDRTAARLFSARSASEREKGQIEEESHHLLCVKTPLADEFRWPARLAGPENDRQ